MSDDLKQLLADFELLNGIEEGTVSPIELAHRSVVLGDSNELLVLPRGFFRDPMMREKVDPDDPDSPTVGDAAWAEFYDSEEYLAWREKHFPSFQPPPPPSFQPETENDEPTPVREPPEPEGTSSHVVKIIRKARRALSR